MVINKIIDTTDKQPERIHTAITRYLNDDLGGRCLIMHGGVGSGKTHVMRTICDTLWDNRPEHITGTAHWYTADDIVNMYRHRNERHYKLRGATWNSLTRVPDYTTAWRLDNRAIDLYIDDIGTEEDLVNYGERANVIAKLIAARHAIWQVDNNRKTMLTTNLSKQEVMTRYGQRAMSRLVEMCGWMEMHADDLRLDAGKLDL